MHFNLDHTTDILSRTPIILKSMLGNLSGEWVFSNEGEQTWSPFDVLGHLIHSEQMNWIPRIKIILQAGESKAFEPFDRFAQFEASRGKSLEELLNRFAELRSDSIQALNNLNITTKDLVKRGKHPELG
ncbi:MAG: DinB family protein, partial [Acidobacteriota bacterium]